MRIFVSGGTGFIGQYLLREEAANNSFVVASRRSGFDGLFMHENILYKCCDYSIESLCELMSGCDAVVHLGALRSTKDNEQSIENYYGNISSTENVFSAASLCGITNAVNISTIAVYGAELPLPYVETEVSPISLYALTKLMSEQLCLYYNCKKSMFIKTLRLSQVLGYGERGGYMLAIFLENCLAGKKLSVYGEGKQARDYIYVKDVVRGIMAALDKPHTKGVFNLGSGVASSNREIAEHYCGVFENSAGVELLTDKPENTNCTQMDMTKTHTELGFSPLYSFKAALEDMKAIIESEGKRN